jgi:hypothetical protein
VATPAYGTPIPATADWQMGGLAANPARATVRFVRFTAARTFILTSEEDVVLQ